MEPDSEGSGLSRGQRHWCCEASDLEAGAQSLNRADGNGRGGVVGNRVRQRLAAADHHRSEVQAAAPEPDSAGTVRTSGEAIASGEQPQAARNHEGCGQPTKQPITVQSDLCVPSSQTTARICGHRSPEMPAPARSVSLLVAASHRLRKGLMASTSGQSALAQIPFSRCTCGANEEKFPSHY